MIALAMFVLLWYHLGFVTALSYVLGACLLLVAFFVGITLLAITTEWYDDIRRTW